MLEFAALAAVALSAQPSPAGGTGWQQAYQSNRAPIQECYAKADQATCEPIYNLYLKLQQGAQRERDAKGEFFLMVEFAQMTRRWSSKELERGSAQLSVAIAGRAFDVLQAWMKQKGDGVIMVHTSGLFTQLSLALLANGSFDQARQVLTYMRNVGDKFWNSRPQTAAPQQVRNLCDAADRYRMSEAAFAEKVDDSRLIAEAYKAAATWAERSAAACPDKPGLPPAALHQAGYLMQYAAALPTDATELRSLYRQVRKLSCDNGAATYQGSWGRLCAEATLREVGETPSAGGEPLISEVEKQPDQPIDWDTWRVIDTGLEKKQEPN